MAKFYLIFWTICLTTTVLLRVTQCASAMHQDVGCHNCTESMRLRTTRNIKDGDDENSINAALLEKQAMEDDDLVHKSFKDGPVENQINWEIQDPLNALQDMKLFKRAPNGFTGMRGKKQFEYTPSAIDGSSAWDWDAAELTSSPENAQLSSWYDASGIRLKKAPLAFYGVRGKKFADGGKQFNSIDDLLRKLEEDRLRDQLLQDFLDRIALSTEYLNEVQKRAPAGFMGMRGKRAMGENNNDNDDQDDLLMGLGKRAPGNAFMGVRGKKQLMQHQAFKRSPSQMTFFGTRGKKQPFVDFRNKFVGVRGKKAGSPHSTSYANYVAAAAAANTASSQTTAPSALDQRAEPFQFDVAPNDVNTQNRYLVDLLPLFFGTSYKRAPSGFLGMRGKRGTNPGTTPRHNDKTNIAQF